MKKATEIINLVVMGIKEGTQKGIVKDFIVGTQSKKVEYLIVQEGRKYNLMLLKAADIVGVGSDFVMVNTLDSVKNIYSEKELMEQAASGFYILDATVLSNAGTFKGTVTDFEMDLQTGEVSKIVMDNGGEYDTKRIEALSNNFVFVGKD